MRIPYNPIIVLALCCCVLASCTRNENTPQNPSITPQLSVTSISPSTGSYNTLVIIEGTNFSTSPSANIVKFNGVLTPVITATSTRLAVTVPLLAGTGIVSITVDNVTANGPVFTYTSRFVSTVAGTGVIGFANGPASAAKFNYPYDLVFDSQGNILLSESTRIRKITPTGTVSSLAGMDMGGFWDGPSGDSSLFVQPLGITIDGLDNLYVADRDNFRIRKVTPAGMVTTFAGTTRGYEDGPIATAKFSHPVSITLDHLGNFYVLDSYRIRKITPDGMVSTLAGTGVPGYANGPGATAQFYELMDIAADLNGNLFVTDHDRIRKVAPNGTVSTWAGTGASSFLNGMGNFADFSGPSGIIADRHGNVYVVDRDNAAIRHISPSTLVTTYAGIPGSHGFADGPAEAAKFGSPIGIAIDNNTGNVYIADRSNHRIRKITN